MHNQNDRWSAAYTLALTLSHEVANRPQVMDKIRSQLTSIKKGHPGQEEVFKVACTTLLKYLGNIANAPDEEKFRYIGAT